MLTQYSKLINSKAISVEPDPENEVGERVKRGKIGLCTVKPGEMRKGVPVGKLSEKEPIQMACHLVFPII
jgi:hypothetical protein